MNTGEGEMQALQRAVDHCGGVNNLARALGVRPSAVSNWFARGVVPTTQALRIVRLDPQVSLEELRPDLFGPQGVERRAGRDRRQRDRRRRP